MIVTDHFVERVRERIGKKACPIEIAKGVLWAVENRRTDLVEYVGRQKCKKNRIFRFRSRVNGSVMQIIFDTSKSKWVAITLYSEDKK